MRWLADECVSADLVARLRAAGHDVKYVAEEAAGATDQLVLADAHRDNRLLLTEDKDFGELVFRRSRGTPGIVLLRIESGNNQRAWDRLTHAIAHFGEQLYGRYTVIEISRMRSRRLRYRR